MRMNRLAAPSLADMLALAQANQTSGSAIPLPSDSLGASRLEDLAGEIPTVKKASARSSLDPMKSLIYLGGGMAAAAGRPGSTGASALGEGALEYMQGEERESDRAIRATSANNAANLNRFKTLAGIMEGMDRRDLRVAGLDQDARQSREANALRRDAMTMDAVQSQVASDDRRREAGLDRRLKRLAMGQDSSQHEDRMRLGREELQARQALAKAKARPDENDIMRLAERYAEADPTSYAADEVRGETTLDKTRKAENVRRYARMLRAGVTPDLTDDGQASQTTSQAVEDLSRLSDEELMLLLGGQR